MVHLDFETRSSVDIKLVGLANYVSDKSTQILMLAYAFDNGEIQLWEPHKNPEIPLDLKQVLLDSSIVKSAWNCAFERGILKEKMRIWIDYEQWSDPQPSARYLSLPGSLDSVGEILSLPAELSKDKAGKRLIDIFSKPSKRRKKRGEEATYYFRDWESDPEDWEQFCSYCKRDVTAEREIQRRLGLLGVYPLPPLERKIWIMDQRINDRGIFVDTQFVRSALKLAEREKQEAIEAQNKLTCLENANSNSQMLEWIKMQGFEGNSLRKGAVDAALKYNMNLTSLGKQVLEARKTASSTSYKKLSAILRQVSSDGHLRNQFIYMGSSRCGRWSGNSVQIHNLARPNDIFEIDENINRARTLILAEDYDGIRKEFGSVLLTVKYNIRTAFIAEKGYRFNICDLGAIETRVGAWIAECQSLLDVFHQGRDPYLDFAVKLSQIPYDILDRDIHSKDPIIKNKAKRHRQVAKPGVLGCMFRLGGGQMGKDKNGDPVKQGLWGYAEAMGVEMTQDQAHEVVRVFRESYMEIKNLWFNLENAVRDVLKEGTVRVKRELGPNGCIKIDKIIFNCNGNPRTILRLQLPSKRFLHYLDAFIDETKMPWQKDGEDVYKPTLCYAGQDQMTKQWKGNITSHGGKLCLAGDTQVVTNKGLIPLRDVKINDLVWDGLDFISHGGVISKGVQEVVSWIGLKGTAEHKILAGNFWLQLKQMDEFATHTALSLGRDLAPALYYLQNQEKREEQNFSVIAEESSQLALDKFGGGRLNLALSAAIKGRLKKLWDILLFPTINYGHLGLVEEQVLFQGALIPHVKPTQIMAEEELHTINHGMISIRGWNLLSLYQIGINSIQTWIESIMTGIMSRGIYGLLIESQTQTTEGKHGWWNTIAKKFLMKFFANNIRLDGAKMHLDGTLTKDEVQNGVWNIIGKQEVFDLIDCGPRHRFMVMTEQGPVLVHNCENVIQGVARDTLAEKLLLLENNGLPIVGHVHDEAITMTEDDPFSPGLIEMNNIMEMPIDWAPNLPLAADGFESLHYKK